MPRLCLALFFSILLGLLAPFAQASDEYLWADNHTESFHKRVFAIAEKEGKYWHFKVFSQDYGDFQELVSENYFESLSDVQNFKQFHYPFLSLKTKLADWPVLNNNKKATNRGLWQASENWSTLWEERYGRWIQEEVGVDFFNRHGIATDCADVIVGLRWVFARMNGLPVANTISATGGLFTNESMLKNWSRLSRDKVWYKDRLFMTALNYIMNLTSTRTLMKDAYPVAMTTEGLRVGSFILTVGADSNHVKLISENYFLDPSEVPLYTISSTTPRSRKDMVREVMLDEEWPVKGVKDFLALRWPLKSSKGTWYLKGATEHSNYSVEQFDEDLRLENPSFIDFLLKRLKPNFSPDKIVEIGVTEIADYLTMRAQIVEDGYKYCQSHNCAEGTSAWDDWSTPSRDGKIAKKFDNYETMLARYEETYPGLLERWRGALKTYRFKLFGEDTPLSTIRYIWRESLYSSDPREKPSRRWGLEYDDFFNKILNELKLAMEERDSIFKRIPNSCELSSCYPKNSVWLSLNTYHADSIILRLNSQIRQYCGQLKTPSCFRQRDQILGVPLETFFGVKTALAWLELAPSLNSEPTVALNLRWGDISSRIVNLESFDDIRIAENSYALIDHLRIDNLSDGKTIVESRLSERLFLTKSGHVLMANLNESGEVKIKLAQNQDWQKLILVSPKRDYDWNLAKLEDTAFGSVVILPVRASEASSEKLLIILNANEEPKQQFVRASWVKVFDEFVLIDTAPSELELLDLRSVQSHVIQYQESEIKKPQLLKFWKFNGKSALGQYSDADEDLYYPVLLNLEKGLLKGLKEYAYSKLVYFNESSESGVLEEKFNAEYPELYEFILTVDGPKKKKLLGNLLRGQGDGFLLIAKGGRWDQNFEHSLYQLNKNSIDLKTKDNSQLKLIDLAGPFLLQKEAGSELASLIDLRHGKVVRKMTENLTLSHASQQEDVLARTSDPKLLITRFNTYMGDYYGLGQIYQSGEASTLELLHTNALALKDGDEAMDRWREKFVTFKVYSGVLLGTGLGPASWLK